MSATILLVEDESTIAEVLSDNLSDEGFEVVIAADGRSGLSEWQRLKPNLVVLDVMLPYLNGFELCRTMRERGDVTPVLFLSAKGHAEDRVQGLMVGGDDYLPKPFHLPEFLLRVRNMLRRQSWGAPVQESHTFSFGGHTVNYRSWVAHLQDSSRETLGERELKIFRLLAEHSDEVISRDTILDSVWGDDAFPSSRTVDNFVVRLRKLFEPNPAEPIYFHTVWGVGYRFTPDGRRQEK